MKLSFLILTNLFVFISFAQIGLIKGRVYNSSNNQGIPQAKVQIIELTKGTITDDNGNFEFSGITPGVYSFKATAPGFRELILNEITVTNARSVDLDFALEEFVLENKEVVVKASPFVRKTESPVSLKTLNATEIERLPGAGRPVPANDR